MNIETAKEVASLVSELEELKKARERFNEDNKKNNFLGWPTEVFFFSISSVDVQRHHQLAFNDRHTDRFLKVMDEIIAEIEQQLQSL